MDMMKVGENEHDMWGEMGEIYGSGPYMGRAGR